MITIIDYGAGNIGSITNMLLRLGKSCEVTNDPEKIKKATKLILPGVGKFDYGMTKLKESGLTEILNEKVLGEKIPILGICLGAQLMTKSSEEGEMSGLSWFDAEVVKFNGETKRIPHMGWNSVHSCIDDIMTANLPENPRFYFVHSYYIHSNRPDEIMFTTIYGHEFVSGLMKNNIYAVQFHPEKSHKFGIQLFKNFLSI